MTISNKNYWQFGKDWNELRANEGHDGRDIDNDKIKELREQHMQGVIAIWNDGGEGDTLEDAHIIEW